MVPSLWALIYVSFNINSDGWRVSIYINCAEYHHGFLGPGGGGRASRTAVDLGRSPRRRPARSTRTRVPRARGLGPLEDVQRVHPAPRGRVLVVLEAGGDPVVGDIDEFVLVAFHLAELRLHGTPPVRFPQEGASLSARFSRLTVGYRTTGPCPRTRRLPGPRSTARNAVSPGTRGMGRSAVAFSSAPTPPRTTGLGYRPTWRW